jgi:hypothetical protein
MTASDDGTYTASIPAALTAPATLLRWRVCVDGASACAPGHDAWFGAPVGAPPTLHGLPVLEWYAPNPAASTSDAGASGTDVIVWGGRGHQVKHVGRKGTTSLSWPKPKLKVRLEGGGRLDLFAGMEGARGAGGAGGGVASEVPFDAAAAPLLACFDLDSVWWEPGENSYARQAVAFAAARALGVPAPAVRYAAVRRNGRFYGLYALVEPQDGAWLARTGLAGGDGGRGGGGAASAVTLWKPLDGAWSNLRPDVPANAWSVIWKRAAGSGGVASVEACIFSQALPWLATGATDGTIKLWDLGGQPRFRSMWERYCRGVGAIVFVADAADGASLDAARAELHDLLSRPSLEGTPLLVLANKNDLPGAASAADVADRLDLAGLGGRDVAAYSISCKSQAGINLVLDWLTQHAK